MKKNEEKVANTLPHVQEKGSIKLRMSFFYGYDLDELPIEGGWGAHHRHEIEQSQQCGCFSCLM